MKLATTTSDFMCFGLNGEESVGAVADAGFKYIDYGFGYDFHGKTGLLGNEWQSCAERLLALADERGLKFVQAHSPLGRPLVFDDEHEEFVRLTKQSVTAAAYLGIPNIVVHSGYAKDMPKAETFKQNKLFYEDILKVAEKHGITVLTENFNKMFDEHYYWVDSAEDLSELIEYIDHPLLKACWDVGHGNLQELPQHEALKMLGDKVRALHIQDNMGNDDHHTFPFTGTLNFDSIMHGLQDINYKGYFTFEADNMPASASRRRKFEEDTRCLQLPVEFRRKYESILYDIGRFILTKYNCFEE